MNSKLELSEKTSDNTLAPPSVQLASYQTGGQEVVHKRHNEGNKENRRPSHKRSRIESGSDYESSNNESRTEDDNSESESGEESEEEVFFSDDEPDEEVLAVVAELQQRWATQKRLAQESRLGANEQVHEMDMPHYAPELVAQRQPEQFNDRLDLNVFLSANGGGTTPNP